MSYIAGAVKIEVKPQDDFAVLSPDEWYDGAVEDVRVSIPTQKNTETELYHILMDIKGVKNLKTCYFYEDTPDGICEYRRKNDFKGIYKLEIPNDLSLIKVRVGNETVAIDFNRFKEKLRAFYLRRVHQECASTYRNTRLKMEVGRTAQQKSCVKLHTETYMSIILWKMTFLVVTRQAKRTSLKI